MAQNRLNRMRHTVCPATEWVVSASYRRSGRAGQGQTPGLLPTGIAPGFFISFRFGGVIEGHSAVFRGLPLPREFQRETPRTLIQRLVAPTGFPTWWANSCGSLSRVLPAGPRIPGHSPRRVSGRGTETRLSVPYTESWSGPASLVQIMGPQPPMSKMLTFEVDLI